MLKIGLVLCCSCFFLANGWSNDTIKPIRLFFQSRDYGIQLNTGIGFLALHTEELTHLPVQRVHCVGLALLIHTRGDKSWQSQYKRPTYGISFNHTGLSNDKILGKSYYLDAHVELPLVHSKTFSFFWKYSFGVAYLTKHFDQLTNPKNIAIGSHWNATASTGFGIRKRWNDFELMSTIEMDHFSNAAIILPNLGLNLPMFKVGISKRIDAILPPVQTIQSTNYSKSLRLTALLIGSTKQYFPTGGKNHPIIGLVTLLTKQFTHHGGVEMSCDLIANNSIYDYSLGTKKTQLDVVQIGLYGGYVLPIDRLHVMLGFGYYVRDKYVPIGKVYTRFGVRYYLNDKFVMNFNVKANWGRADYIEFGLGYSLLWKKR
jgi:hypothetical protein